MVFVLTSLSYVNVMENIDDKQFPIYRKIKVLNLFLALTLSNVSFNRIHALIESKILYFLIFESKPICASCLESKMTKRLFKAKGNHTALQLELIYMMYVGY